MKTNNLFTKLAVGITLAGLASAAWFLLISPVPEFCELSGRMIHENMRTVVRIGGREIHTCCPRCALTVAKQTGEEIKLVRVTDYVSSKPLDPEAAYFVSESRITVCYAPRVKFDEAHTLYLRMFDRCGPSLIAFAREADARAFMDENGGHLARLPSLMQEALSDSKTAPDEGNPE